MEKPSKLPPFGTWQRPHSHNVSHELVVSWGKKANGLFVRVDHTFPTLIRNEPRRSDQIQILRVYGLDDVIIGETEGWGENENRYLDDNGSIT